MPQYIIFVPGIWPGEMIIRVKKSRNIYFQSIEFLNRVAYKYFWRIQDTMHLTNKFFG